jgi:hypothetical protein
MPFAEVLIQEKEMNLDIWTTSKSASKQLWTWVSDAVSENPLIGVGLIGFVLVLWWLLKPKFKNG